MWLHRGEPRAWVDPSRWSWDCTENKHAELDHATGEGGETGVCQWEARNVSPRARVVSRKNIYALRSALRSGRNLRPLCVIHVVATLRAPLVKDCTKGARSSRLQSGVPGTCDTLLGFPTLLLEKGMQKVHTSSESRHIRRPSVLPPSAYVDTLLASRSSMCVLS